MFNLAVFSTPNLQVLLQQQLPDDTWTDSSDGAGEIKLADLFDTLWIITIWQNIVFYSIFITTFPSPIDPLQVTKITLSISSFIPSASYPSTLRAEMERASLSSFRLRKSLILCKKLFTLDNCKELQEINCEGAIIELK